MSVMTWTRPAKCKDCKFLKDDGGYARTKYKCDNPQSTEYGKQRFKKDFVCKVWEL